MTHPPNSEDTHLDGDVEQCVSFTGRCVGGPLDGDTVRVRFPRGFLLVDRPANHCWLYDWQPDGTFRCRSDEPMPVLDEGVDNRFRAADEGDFDVIAAPWVGA